MTEPKAMTSTAPTISATLWGFMAFLLKRGGLHGLLTTGGRTIQQGFAEKCGQEREQLRISSHGPVALDRNRPFGCLQLIGCSGHGRHQSACSLPRLDRPTPMVMETAPTEAPRPRS